MRTSKRHEQCRTDIYSKSHRNGMYRRNYMGCRRGKRVKNLTNNRHAFGQMEHVHFSKERAHSKNINQVINFKSVQLNFTPGQAQNKNTDFIPYFEKNNNSFENLTDTEPVNEPFKSRIPVPVILNEEQKRKWRCSKIPKPQWKTETHELIRAFVEGCLPPNLRNKNTVIYHNHNDSAKKLIFNSHIPVPIPASEEQKQKWKASKIPIAIWRKQVFPLIQNFLEETRVSKMDSHMTNAFYDDQLEDEELSDGNMAEDFTINFDDPEFEEFKNWKMAEDFNIMFPLQMTDGEELTDTMTTAITDEPEEPNKTKIQLSSNDDKQLCQYSTDRENDIQFEQSLDIFDVDSFISDIIY